MNCKNWILTEDGRKKGSGEPIKKVVAVQNWWLWRTGQLVFKRGTPEYDKQELCGGAILVSVRIEVDGGCGACGSSSVAISYKCSRCACTHYPELPQDASELGTYLAVSLSKMPDAEHDKLVEHCWNAEVERIKKLEEFRARHKGPGKP